MWDDVLVWEMRTFTANYLEAHYDYFQPFHEGDYTEILKEILTNGTEAKDLAVGPLQVVLKMKTDMLEMNSKY